jgi:transcriptional regulator with XRE-family HTH domain
MLKVDKELLKKRIVEAREKKKLNQAQLAAQAGITPAAVSQIENGLRVPSIPVFQKIASVLGVSMDYLAGKTDEVEMEDLLHQEETRIFFRNFQSLDFEDQKTILKHIEFLKAKAREEEGDDA